MILILFCAHILWKTAKHNFRIWRILNYLLGNKITLSINSNLKIFLKFLTLLTFFHLYASANLERGNILIFPKKNIKTIFTSFSFISSSSRNLEFVFNLHFLYRYCWSVSFLTFLIFDSVDVYKLLRLWHFFIYGIQELSFSIFEFIKSHVSYT